MYVYPAPFIVETTFALMGLGHGGFLGLRRDGLRIALGSGTGMGLRNLRLGPDVVPCGATPSWLFSLQPTNVKAATATSAIIVFFMCSPPFFAREREK